MKIQLIENPGLEKRALHILKLRQANYSLSVPTDLPRAERFDVVFEANQADQCVGGLVLSQSSGTAVIETLWTHPRHRRQKIGSTLVGRAEDFARVKNALRVITTTFVYQGVLQFWLTQGFVIFARLPGRNPEEELIYLHKEI